MKYEKHEYLFDAAIVAVAVAVAIAAAVAAAVAVAVAVVIAAVCLPPTAKEYGGTRARSKSLWSTYTTLFGSWGTRALN